MVRAFAIPASPSGRGRLLAAGLILGLSAGAAGPALAQSQSAAVPADVAVSDLKAPPSPALVLLGVSPSSIDRPTGTRAVVVSALSALSVGDGFPKNYGFEVAPYWFASHPSKSFKDYYEANAAQTIKQQLSISVATAAIEGDPDIDSGTSIALGVKTLIQAGKPHPFLERTRAKLDAAYKRYLNATEITPVIRVLTAAREAARRKLGAASQLTTFQAAAEKLERLEEDIRDVDDRLKNASEAEQVKLLAERAALVARQPALQAEALAVVMAEQGGVKSDGEAVLLLDTLLTSMEATRSKQAAAAESAMRTHLLEIQDFDLQRIGFMAAVAGGMSWDVPLDATASARRGRSGLWFTPSYRWVTCLQDTGACDAAVDLTGVLRYTHDSRFDSTSASGWDTGLRVTWQPRPSLAAAFEWVHRSLSGEVADSTRAAAILEYSITDSAFLYASFGRDVSEAKVRRNLASVVGVTFGFGRQPMVRAFEPRAGES